jgi:cytoskeletal protein RodZ
MKRILLICGVVLVLGIVILTCLFACGDKNKNKEKTTSANTTATSTTVTTTHTAPTTTTAITSPPTQTTLTTTETTEKLTTTTTTPPTTTITSTIPKPTPTQPPQTQPPVTQPPITQPPQTQPPVTEPPQKTVFDDVAMQELLEYGQSLGFGYTFGAYRWSNLSFAINDNSEVLILQRSGAPEGTLKVGHKENRLASNAIFNSFNNVSSIEAAKNTILNFYNSQS